MAYDEMPRKKIEVREDKNSDYSGHDKLIDNAKACGKYGNRTDASSQGDGYLGMDDLDRIRRRKLK